MTQRPLKEGEQLNVRCDSWTKSGQRAWIVCATTVSPNEMDFDKDLTCCDQGQRWVYVENKIYFQDQLSDELNFDLDDLQVSFFIT